MSLNFNQTVRQSRSLSRTMIAAIAVMRMNRADLQELIADTADQNPFVDTDPASGPMMEPAFRPANLIQPDQPDQTRHSLYRHITEQFPFAFDSPHDLEIAFAFLRELEPSGWLGAPVDRIANEAGFEPADCAAVLSRLQALDPIGVFARNLRECLRLQAADKGVLDETMCALITHLNEVSHGSMAPLARLLGVDESDIAQRLACIRRMDPKPGARFEYDDTLMRDCDVVVSLVDRDLVIELNRSSFPTIRVSSASQFDHGKSGNQQQFRALLQNADMLKKACDLRNSTTLTVVTAIFTRQHEFLSQGYPALRPMRMLDIALDAGLSESTVSRILNGLTILCPNGVILAKTLFCNAVDKGGQPQTKYAVLQEIRNMIGQESKKSPLTDSEITKRLQAIGLTLSRRTVGKYRQELGLNAPASRRADSPVQMK